MLVSRDYKTVLITPMKVGSTTAEHVFASWRYVMGPHPWDRSEIEKHTDIIPYECQRLGAKRLLLIRNPYERVESLFNHHIRYHVAVTWDVWFAVHFPTAYHDACTTAYPAHDAIVRIEHFHADMLANGCHTGPIPRENQSPQRAKLPRRFYDDVETRYAGDFAAGGYGLRS